MTPPWKMPSGHGLPSPAVTWVRRHKALAALLPALVLAAAIGISLGTRGPGHPGHRAAAAAPVRVPELAASTKGAKWLTGPAGRLLQAVTGDLGRLTAGETAGRPAAARTAGAQLATAARAALSGPMPPADARKYRSALKELERASMYIASGKFRTANTILNRGDSDIAKVTSAVNRPAKVRYPAAVTEPNGQ
jgi:hypothetical protein